MNRLAISFPTLKDDILDLFCLFFVDGSVMPSWFDIQEIPITAVSLALFSLLIVDGFL
jgi:hypothetical protein